MKKYEGPSIKDVKTDTGKLPANVGFPGNMSGPTNPEGIEGPNEIKQRLEYLRKELRAERISYGELAELESLSPYIEPDDIELLQAIKPE